MTQDPLSLHGPIRVMEIGNKYLVQIHPEDKDLAKALPGRSWDGNNRVWVWKKNEKNFSNLSKQFKLIADEFNITEGVTLPESPGKTSTENDFSHYNSEDSDAFNNIVFPEFEEANEILRDLPPIEYEVFARLKEIDQKLDLLLHEEIGISTINVQPEGQGIQLAATDEKESVKKPMLKESIGQELDVPFIVRKFSANTVFNNVIDNIKRGNELQSPITQVFNQIEVILSKNLYDKLIADSLMMDPKAIKQDLETWLPNSKRWKNERIILSEYPLTAKELYLASDRYNVYAFPSHIKANIFYFGLKDIVRFRNEIHEKNIKFLPSNVSCLKWYCMVAEAFDVLAQE
jgi:hypothetical protein